MQDEKIKYITHSATAQHVTVDGNKRIGILVMITFLELNSISLTYTDDELIALGLGLADGSIDDKMLLDWIISHN